MLMLNISIVSSTISSIGIISDSSYVILTLLVILYYIITIIYVDQSTLQKILFKKYKKIKINTTIKIINNKFVINYILFTESIPIICNILLYI